MEEYTLKLTFHEKVEIKSLIEQEIREKQQFINELKEGDNFLKSLLIEQVERLTNVLQKIKENEVELYGRTI